jgi:hypothetical protein
MGSTSGYLLEIDTPHRNECLEGNPLSKEFFDSPDEIRFSDIELLEIPPTQSGEEPKSLDLIH